jgi:alkylation response protein AidB-like acyl-CoA dehydrogenase
MPIGIGEDHEELRRTVRRWLETRCPPSVPRALLDAELETMPPFWDELASQGWLGIHVAEEHGGQGFGMLELAVVVEEMARAAMPGPAVPTMLAAAVVAAGADDAQRKVLLAPMAEGIAPTAVVLPGSGTLEGTRAEDGTLAVRGQVSPVLGATLATRLLVAVDISVPGAATASAGTQGTASANAPGIASANAAGIVWCVVDIGGDEVTTAPLGSLDPTRRVGSVRVEGAVVPPERQLSAVSSFLVRDLALVVAAAECAGGARWCLEVGTQHAIDRRQFGRPIGQFQAVKHRLADMLVAVEQVTALAWDAAQAADVGDPAQAQLSAVLAGAFVLDAYVECAKGCIQILGGMGFTWEHDAHVHLRRALALRQLVGPPTDMRVEASRAALDGSRRRLVIELPEDAERVREQVRAVVAEVAAAPDSAERRRRLVETGLLTPHWPVPWGRGAGPVEQLMIDEELAAAHVHRPHLAVGAWALPTIIAHGTVEQQERWVGPTLQGELVWCQLFSEPGAGSDLAALSTRAIRHDGGWVLTGPKGWTSIAMRADWGICLARSDPDADKHEGITYFIVDMHSEGIEVRPLREITGAAMFNEVFFTDVFVPDDCVVGPVNGGWRLARTTLANERVSMASGATFGFGIEGILKGIGTHGHDAVVLDAVGGLLAEAQSVAVLGARTTLRSVSGVEPGPEASVRKLLGAEHEQRVQELGLMLLGASGATTEDDAGRWSQGFLSTRCLTIAGGTSEVQRNVIGERILGLPRDPEPGS